MYCIRTYVKFFVMFFCERLFLLFIFFLHFFRDKVKQMNEQAFQNFTKYITVVLKLTIKLQDFIFTAYFTNRNMVCLSFKINHTDFIFTAICFSVHRCRLKFSQYRYKIYHCQCHIEAYSVILFGGTHRFTHCGVCHTSEA